ncbi:MAG: methyltransferase domain-containing protein [Pseudomonadota bacterium]
MSKEGKEIISRRFSRAAPTYDEYALVQKESGVGLLSLLPENFVSREILEIGCGTGGFTARLADRFPQARITAIDFAQGMINQAGGKFGGRSHISFCCRDGEVFLRENRGKYDLVTSNATMQWFDDIEQAFGNAARALGENGIFLASFFGPESLRELATGLSAVLGKEVLVAAGYFAGKEKISRLARNCFHDVMVSEKIYSRSYPTFRSLLNHISKTGTGGYHPSLPPLTGRKIAQLETWFNGKGGYDVTYQVFFLKASGRRG